DEGPTAEDEDLAAGDEGLATGDEGPSMRVESLGLGRDAAVLKGQQRATPVVETAVVRDPRHRIPPHRFHQITLIHASPTLVPILRRTARMVVRVPPAMSPGLSASIAEVAAMSDLAFRKRFWSSNESSPSLSPPDLPLRKRYRGTSELVEDDEEEEDDDEEEDKEIEERDEGLATGDEGPSTRVESLGLGRDAAVLKAVGEPLGLGYEALRRREIALEEGRMPSVLETPLSPKLSSGSLLVFLAPFIAPLPISPPTIPLTVQSPVASPARAETERYQFRSLEHKHERVAVTFGVTWRPVLALESWAGQTDAQRAALWHAISDTHMENQELRLQIAKDRRV
nr:hypothetical protein [Tanacetum cinerariifolium]